MRKTPAPDAPWIVSPIRQLCGVESWMRTGGAGFGPSRSAPASFVCRSELDLALTLDILNRELGVKRLLLERGGGANGAFLRAGLVDELNSSVRPWTARRVRRASSIRRRQTLTSGPRHGNDAGEQRDFRRRCNAAAVPDPERESLRRNARRPQLQHTSASATS
jgi:hypothetical protein